MTDYELEQIIDIWLDSNIKTHNYVDSEYWKQNVDVMKTELPKADLYVCEINQKIVGFIGLVDEYIAGIFVQEQYRGQSIGRELLTQAKKVKSSLFLHVYKKNKRAISFYESQVFKIVKSQIDEQTLEPELIMMWNKNT